MADHFKYYPSDEAVVTPFNAKYAYPSQANKAVKMTPRIAPKNGLNFAPGQTIRVEFPAQGYVNPLNTMLEFDVVLIAPANAGCFAIRFQNNIQSIFNRVTLKYGSGPQEDILQYGLLVRFLTESTSTGQNNNVNQGSICDGIGGTSTGAVFNASNPPTATTAATSGPLLTTFTVGTGEGLTAKVGEHVIFTGVINSANINMIGVYWEVYAVASTTITVVTPGIASGTTWAFSTGRITPMVHAFGLLNTRQSMIQGIEEGFTAAPYSVASEDGWLSSIGFGSGYVPNSNQRGSIPGGMNVPTTTYTVRRYMVNLALGIFTQDKLIPTKYMASQLAIEIVLEQPQSCIYQPIGVANNTSSPSYMVGNVELIPEIIEFDDTYDIKFMEDLNNGGVPLKFSTWSYYQFSTQGAATMQVQIAERSRSVKGIIAFQRRQTGDFSRDSHACLFDSCTSANSSVAGSTMKEYQYRIGGRYHPGAPVQLCLSNQTSTNGGSEAYIELAKFLNIVGDARLSTNIIPVSWAVPAITNAPLNQLPEHDYSYSITSYDPQGTPRYIKKESEYSAYCGNAPSSMFASAINFETSNGLEISGLNAEEQSDISFTAKWSNPQAADCQIEIFTFVDRLWVLRPNNFVDLIQ